MLSQVSLLWAKKRRTWGKKRRGKGGKERGRKRERKREREGKGERKREKSVSGETERLFCWKRIMIHREKYSNEIEQDV